MPYEHVVFPYPDGGMNEMYPAHLIGDNQFSNAINYYYEPSGRLVSRHGTEFIARFNDPVWGVGTLPDYGKAVAVQSGSVLYGRSGFFGNNYQFISIATGLAAGDRYFATMNTALYSGTWSGSSTADNIKWVPNVSTTVTIPGSPPALSILCTWNGRMWGVHRNLPTKLYFSKVGDPDDWTTGGVSGAGFIDVGYSDGQTITGLIAHNEQLFIFKERSIWHIVTANPNTDNTLWRVELVSKNYGCSNHRALVVSGNDVLFPSAQGILSLNAALYQGDFSVSAISEPINYISGGDAVFSRVTNQHLYAVSWKPERDIYCFDKTERGARWAKMHIYNAAGRKLAPWLLFDDYPALETYGNYYYGQHVTPTYAGIVVVNQPYYDLLQYPTTHQGPEGNYDYIDGPEGSVPIRKSYTSKMWTFGDLAHDKKSNFVSFACVKHDRDPQYVADETTVSVIFNQNNGNEQQDTVITDSGTDVINDENTVAIHRNRTPLRVGVMGIGGANGRAYKGIQIKVENNMGGYQLEWSGLEMNVDKEVDRFPRPSEKMLS